MQLTSIIFITIMLSLSLSSTLASTRNNYFDQQTISFGFYDHHILPNNPSRPPHPLFWRSRGKVENGVTFIYEQLTFHTQKYFSINLGGSLSSWQIQSQTQLALSFFFAFRIWFFRTDCFNPYFVYSIAGPTLLSRRVFAGHHLGEHFIFQDFLGLGVVIGKQHHVDIALKLYHYSNGDFFVHNDGFDVPVVLTIGYAF